MGDATGEAIRDALGQPRTTVTDANGYYQFVGLLPGLYTVRQIQPADYLDFIDTPGTTGGIAINRNDSISPLLLETLTVAHDFDAIIRIPLPAGVNSVENNFSEIKIAEARRRGHRPCFLSRSIRKHLASLLAVTQYRSRS